MPEACALDVATTGVADALLYWWRLGYDAESISTRPDLDGGGPLSHWRCAACVLRPGLSVSAGDTARLVVRGAVRVPGGFVRGSFVF